MAELELMQLARLHLFVQMTMELSNSSTRMCASPCRSCVL